MGQNIIFEILMQFFLSSHKSLYLSKKFKCEIVFKHRHALKVYIYLASTQTEYCLLTNV